MRNTWLRIVPGAYRWRPSFQNDGVKAGPSPAHLSTADGIGPTRSSTVAVNGARPTTALPNLPPTVSAATLAPEGRAEGSVDGVSSGAPSATTPSSLQEGLRPAGDALNRIHGPLDAGSGEPKSPVATSAPSPLELQGPRAVRSDHAIALQTHIHRATGAAALAPKSSGPTLTIGEVNASGANRVGPRLIESVDALTDAAATDRNEQTGDSSTSDTSESITNSQTRAISGSTETSEKGTSLQQQVTALLRAAWSAATRGQTPRVEANLSPPDLGRIRIEVQGLGEQSTARILVADEHTLQLLRSTLSELRQSLQDNGWSGNLDLASWSEQTAGGNPQSHQQTADSYSREPDRPINTSQTPLRAPAGRGGRRAQSARIDLLV